MKIINLLETKESLTRGDDLLKFMKDLDKDFIKYHSVFPFILEILEEELEKFPPEILKRIVLLAFIANDIDTVMKLANLGVSLEDIALEFHTMHLNSNKENNL